MNLSTAILDGAWKLIQKIVYKPLHGNPHSVIRVYDLKDSRVPSKILYESKINKGLFIDEVNDKMYKQLNGKLVAI